MSYLYKIVGGSYEGCTTDILSHEACFTKEEFHDLVVKATPLAVELRLRAHGTDAWVVRLEDIHNEVVESLCTHFGFTCATFQADFRYDSWSDIGADAEDTGTEQAMCQAITNAGYPPELFKEMFLGSPPDTDDESMLEGYYAGRAFRLNEIAGRKVFPHAS